MTAVITGVGAVSAFGVGVRALHDGLLTGGSAVRPLREIDGRVLPVQVGGEVALGDARAQLASQGLPAPLLAAWAERGWLRDRKLAFGLLAAREAWAMAGAGEGERGAWLSLALGLEQAFLEDFDPMLDPGRIAWERAAGTGVQFRSPVDLTARALREWLGLTGPTVVHASACAAGGLSVAHAAALVSRGQAEVVLCGGADSMLNPLGIGGMARLGAPSPRPSPDACRPFDRRRDGLAMGEGAAVFVVESEARAQARGARVLARIVGWGSTQDAYRVTAPRPDGSQAQAAMERALRRASLPEGALGYVNAHGTGTPLNDPAEARAIRAALGPQADAVAVSSIKGAVGHLMAASGAIELAACLLAFERDLLPGTANLEQVDPECPLDLIGPAPRPRRVEAVLSNSFGFGGQNVSVVLRRGE
jgi:3-oxoacyl-[acyl-carrier-protein] synthase II